MRKSFDNTAEVGKLLDLVTGATEVHDGEVLFAAGNTIELTPDGDTILTNQDDEIITL